MNQRELWMNVYNSSKIGHANVSFYEDGQHVYTIGANILRNVPQLAVPRFAPFQRDDGIYRDESADHLAAIVEGTVISAGVPVTDLEYEELLSQARELEGQTFNYSVFTEACVELVERFYEEAGHPGEFGDLYPEEARTGSLVWQRVPITDTSIISTWPDDVPYYTPPALLLPDPPTLPAPRIFGDLPPAPATPEEARMLAEGDGGGAATEREGTQPESSDHSRTDADPNDGPPELTFGLATDISEARWAVAERLTFGAEHAGQHVGAVAPVSIGEAEQDDARIDGEEAGEQKVATERSATLPEAADARRTDMSPDDGHSELTFGVAGNIPEEGWAAADGLTFGAELTGTDTAAMILADFGETEDNAASGEAASISEPSAAASVAAASGDPRAEPVAINQWADPFEDIAHQSSDRVAIPQPDTSTDAVLGDGLKPGDDMTVFEQPVLTFSEAVANTDRTVTSADADHLSATVEGPATYEVTAFGEDAELLSTSAETHAVAMKSDAEAPTRASAETISSVEPAGVTGPADHPSALPAASAEKAPAPVSDIPDSPPAIDQEIADADEVALEAPTQSGAIRRDQAAVEPQPAPPVTAAVSREVSRMVVEWRDDDDDDDGSDGGRNDASPKSSSAGDAFSSGDTRSADGPADFGGFADEFDFGPSPSTELSFGDAYDAVSSIDAATFSEPDLSFGDFDTGSSYDVGYDMGTTSFDDGYSFF